MTKRFESDPALDEVVGGVWLPEGKIYPKTFLEHDTLEPVPKGPNFFERHKVAVAWAGATAAFVAGVAIRGVTETVREPQTS